jgi:hypothetical protein
VGPEVTAASQGPEVFADAELLAAVAATARTTGLISGLLPIAETGRPRLITVEALLAGMHLACAASGGAAVPLTDVAHILGRRLPDRWVDRFGLLPLPEPGAHGFEALYARVRRLFHAVLALINPSPFPGGGRMTGERRELLTAQADPAAAEAARLAGIAVTGALLEDSIAGIRALMDAHWDGSVSADGTAIAAFARPAPFGSPLGSTDPDAGWYIRDGDHADPAGPGPTTAKNTAKTAKPARRKLFGFEATLVPIDAHTVELPGHPPGTRLPAVVLGMVLDKPGARPGPNATAVLADIHARGHRPGGLAADRAFNNSTPETFQLPIRALGYRPAYDYPRDELGVQHGGPAGEIMIEGTWHCPQTPVPLVNATRTLHQRCDEIKDHAKTPGADPGECAADKRAAQAAWTAQIAERQAFALVPHGTEDSGGHQRFRCPAAAGHVRCPRKPVSVRPGSSGPRIDPGPEPFGDPPVCHQTTITIAPETGARHRQTHPYGTEAWQDAYQPGRATVESVNAHLKDGAHENIQDPRGRRVRGLAATGLMLAFQIAHANRRKITNWQATLPAHPDAEPERRPPRRKTKPLTHWTPRGHHPGPEPADTAPT